MRRFLQPIIREIGQAIAQEASKASKSSLPDIISISVTIILTLIALVGAVITIYMYLSDIILARHAMLLVTMGVIFFALASGLTAKKIMTGKVLHEDEVAIKYTNRNDEYAQQNEMVAALGIEAAKLVEKNPKNAALIAMTIGITMGVSPELRKAVFDYVLPKS